MTASSFFAYLLFIVACIPLLSFLAGVIIRIYFNEKRRFWAEAMNSVSNTLEKKMEELKNGN